MKIPTEFTRETDEKIGQMHFHPDAEVSYLELNEHQYHSKDYQGIDLHLTMEGLYLNYVGSQWFDGTMDQLVAVEEKITQKMLDEDHIERIILRKETIKMTELPGKAHINKDVSQLKQLCREYGKYYDIWRRYDVCHEIANILSTEQVKAHFVQPFRQHGNINKRRWENGPIVKKVAISHFIDDILFFPVDTFHFTPPEVKIMCGESKEDFVQTRLFE